MPDFTERQRNIIDAAINIIADYGLQNLSIRRLAREVGINESTIYSHFKSKDEILECIIATYMQHAVSWCKEFDLKGTSSINKLELYFKKLSIVYLHSVNRAKVYWLGLINSNGETFERIKDVHLYYKRWIYRTIEEGQQNGEIINDFSAENLSSIIIGPINLCYRRLTFDNNYNIEENSLKEWKVIEKLLSGK